MAKKNPFIEINNRRIGVDYPVYIIAELSANHQQKFENAVNLLKEARDIGVDAVKLQTYTPDTITIDIDSDLFRHRKRSLWADRTLYQLYSEAYMPWKWQPHLKKIAEEFGIDFFSTAFDPTAVDFLEEMGVPVHKVASFEIVDIPLIEKMALTGKPLIISTGMAALEEIDDAVNAARASGAKEIALLKCTSTYPARPEDMNLRAIPYLSKKFKVPIGLSDHTLGGTVVVAAVAMGACIVEKHFTLSRQVEGPDSGFSMEPEEFRAMVQAIRVTEKALGEEGYVVGKREVKNRAFRRSLFMVKDIQTGEIFTEENVRSIRPGHGLAPKYLSRVLGKKAGRNIDRGTPLNWDLIA